MCRPWVAEEGFGVQRRDEGHRRWDVDSAGMQKWDLGCRYGMKAQDRGCFSTRAPRRSPSSAQGFCSAPGDGECVRGAGKRRLPRKKLLLSNPIQTFCSSSPIWEADPGLSATSARQMCRGGERSPCGWETSPLPSVQARLGMPLSHITPAPQKGLDGSREQREGRTGWDQSSLTNDFHCNSVLVLWLGEVAMRHSSSRGHSPGWPSTPQ